MLEDERAGAYIVCFLSLFVVIGAHDGQIEG